MNSYALRNISYGLYIIGAMDKDRPSGCTANSAMQITSEPATLALSLNHDNYTNSLIKETGRFAISVLSETSDPGLIGGFGFRSGRSANKFDGVKYSMKEGVPVVDDSCAYIVCRVINSMETSTHTVFLGEVIDAELSDGVPMTYAYYHKVIKGKSPKNAPTYIPEPAVEQKKEEKAVEKKWECSVCGYEYDGDGPFEELPEDYVCPVCGQPKSVFEAK